MIVRFFWRPWTSAPLPAESSIPFGPLRFRGWTSAPIPAESGIPFGPLRFRSWTSGDEIIVPPVILPPINIGGRFVVRPEFFGRRQRILKEDDDLLAIILAWLQATDGGRK